MCEEDVLVKMAYESSGFVSFRTYERAFGSRGRFLIVDKLLEEAIVGLPGCPFYDSDCGNYVEFTRDGDFIKFTFLWLSTKSGRFFSGMKQHVMIPISVLERTLFLHEPMRSLCRVPNKTCNIDASCASRTLKRILPDKQKRHAFRKAMRDCFGWHGDTIHLSDDGGNDFYFTTASGFPKNGGLILHHGKRDGHDCIYYSVHT